MKVTARLMTGLLLLSSLGAIAQSDSTVYKQVQATIDEARQQFAPDRRTRLVELKEDNIRENRYHIWTTEAGAVSFLQEKLASTNAKLTVSLYPTAEVADKPRGVINLSVANLRTSPSHAAEMATQLLMGTSIDILEARSGDYRVRTPEGYIAWVPRYSVTAMTQKEYDTWLKTDKIIYTNEFGKSYSTNTGDGLRVSDLVYGNLLALKERRGQYYHVSYPDGREAYVAVGEAQPFDEWKNSRQLTIDNVLKSAKTMMGLPYLWGGTSVKGVDCSGFTKTVFYMNGHIIPRDASQQVLAGDVVDIMDQSGDFDSQKALKELKPGDLLFFAGAKGQRPNPRVTHVAIYIGNGEFIHAAGAVRINSFLADRDNYDDFQSRTLVGARRYIGSDDPQIQQITASRYY